MDWTSNCSLRLMLLAIFPSKSFPVLAIIIAKFSPYPSLPQAYDPILGPPLVATLRLLLEPSPSSPSTSDSSSPSSLKRRTALVATTIRNPTTFESFIAQARESTHLFSPHLLHRRVVVLSHR